MWNLYFINILTNVAGKIEIIAVEKYGNEAFIMLTFIFLFLFSTYKENKRDAKYDNTVPIGAPSAPKISEPIMTKLRIPFIPAPRTKENVASLTFPVPSSIVFTKIKVAYKTAPGASAERNAAPKAALPDSNIK